MSGLGPYALDAWYPAVRASVCNTRILGAMAAPSAGEVKAAWAQLAPGGALVIIHQPRGRWTRLLGWGGRSVAERFPGVGRTDRWFVLPGTGGSHVLLPVGRAGFAAGLRLLPAGRRKWRAARWLLARLGCSGLAGLLGFRELFVVVKGPPKPPSVPWMAGRAHAHVTIALGVPGALRKAVALVSGDEGEVHGLLKLSISGASQERVRHEAETLEGLHGLSPETTFAPVLYGHGHAGGTSWLAQSFLEGQRSPDVLGEAHLRFLADLHGRTAADEDLRTLKLFQSACARIDALRGTDEDWCRAMTELRDALCLRLDGDRVPCSRCHGDFTPWNLVVTSGRLVAFDWEFSYADTPALFDLFHFHFQTGILVRHVDARRLFHQVDRIAAGPGRKLLKATGVEPTRIAALAGLYVLHVATFDEELNRAERPPFVQVEWLRRARIQLARLLQARLLNEVRRDAGRRVCAA